jgi:hypothetical protein
VRVQVRVVMTGVQVLLLVHVCFWPVHAVRARMFRISKTNHLINYLNLAPQVACFTQRTMSAGCARVAGSDAVLAGRPMLTPAA